MADDDWIELRGQDLLIKTFDSPSNPGQALADVLPDTPPELKLGDTVLVDFTVRQSDHKEHQDGPICQKVTSWLVPVGQQLEKEIPDALDIALQNMKNHQTALIWSTAKFAYGTEGTRSYKDNNTSYELPPNSSVLYHITKMMQVKDTSRLNPYFTLQRNTTRKKIANDLYIHEWPQQREKAVLLYTKAAKDMMKLMEGTYFQQVGKDHPQYKEARQILMDSYNNILALRMRSKQYTAAREAGEMVLQQDPSNRKALLRLAKVAMLDPKSSLNDANQAIQRIENVITYKDTEEEGEVKKLRAQWKKKKAASTGAS